MALPPKPKDSSDTPAAHESDSSAEASHAAEFKIPEALAAIDATSKQLNDSRVARESQIKAIITEDNALRERLFDAEKKIQSEFESLKRALATEAIGGLARGALEQRALDARLIQTAPDQLRKLFATPTSDYLPIRSAERENPRLQDKILDELRRERAQFVRELAKAQREIIELKHLNGQLQAQRSPVAADRQEAPSDVLLAGASAVQSADREEDPASTAEVGVVSSPAVDEPAQHEEVGEPGVTSPNSGERTQSGSNSGIYLFVSFDLVNSTKYKEEHEQWPEVMSNFYEAVRTHAIGQVGNSDRARMARARIWKYVGDEVLLYVPVQTVKELQEHCELALSIVDVLSRNTEERCRARGDKVELSVKAAMWIADVRELATNGLADFGREGGPVVATEEAGQEPLPTSLQVDPVGQVESSTASESNGEGQETGELFGHKSSQPLTDEENGYTPSNICIVTHPGSSGVQEGPTLLDFLGTEVDAGFRIAKFAHRRVAIVSAELAELLSMISEELRFKLRLMGYEKLKGVWKDKHYPIVWMHRDWDAFRARAAYDEDLLTPMVSRVVGRESHDIEPLRRVWTDPAHVSRKKCLDKLLARLQSGCG